VAAARSADRNAVTVAGAGTTFSAPSIVTDGNGVDIAAEGPGDSLMFYCPGSVRPRHRLLGMLAIPVMAGSTSYALSEARGKQEGLDLKLRQGRYFCGVIAASMLIGLGLNFTGVSPIKALVFTAVFNGVAAVLLIWFIDRIAADRGTIGGARSGWLSRSMLILTFMGMAGSVVAMVISHIRG
jgi:hypothetical protein